MLSKIFKKLVKSYALDAIDWFDPEKEYKGLKGEVRKFMKASSAARVESHKSVGLGTDYRMESRKITSGPRYSDSALVCFCPDR
jgi:hypothetical protein